MRNPIAVRFAILGCVLVQACADGPPRRPVTDFTVEPAQYDAAFTAAEDVLRDAGFTLDRVDAHRGVISTRPCASAGYATPWIDQGTSPGDDAGGVIHRERRVAVVKFDHAIDHPDDPEQIIARVEVTVQRLGAPGRKPEPSSIRLLSRWTGGAGPGANQTPFTTMTERSDDELAARLARRIESRITPSNDRSN